ncbi:MAG TPA: NYN domain-containing protein [Sediminispirochaeta sp.]|nr:NYN domain-containing protein [Sediminispirochaeta sp.]
MKTETIAVIWNIEDVRPSINSTFVKGLMNYARTQGLVSIAKVFGDWSHPISPNTAQELYEAGFEMIHLPTDAAESLRLSLGSVLVDVINRNPHIDRLLLISGDGKLSAALSQVSGHGVKTTVICDARNAEEDLLLLAENFMDFRDLTLSPLEETGENDIATTVELEEAFLMLGEAVRYIEQNGGIPTLSRVRARMALLNEGFDEADLGYDSWSAFLAAAEEHKVLKTRFKEGRLVLTLVGGTDTPPTIITLFLSALKRAASKTITSEGNKAKLGDIKQILLQEGVDFRRHGYSSLKKVADTAAKRGLVFVSLKGSDYLLDLTKKGSQYIA